MSFFDLASLAKPLVTAPLALAYLDLDSDRRGELGFRLRREPLTVLQAIQRQLTHYAYHVGQIVYLAKHYSADRWKSLSIVVGQSEQFNRAPTKYADPASGLSP